MFRSRADRFRFLLAAFFSVALTNNVKAISAAILIDDPVPDALRQRVVEMLRKERAKDLDDALARTKIIDRGWRETGQVILRIEADCRQGLCMTIIGRVTAETIIPELTLNAGKSFYLRDAAFPLWRSDNPAWAFEFEGGGGSTLIALSRDGRWVVEAEGGRGQ